jgi:hypothetical protein
MRLVRDVIVLNDDFGSRMSGAKKPPKGKGGGKPGREAPRPRLPPHSSLTELSVDSPKGNRYRVLRTSEKDATDVDQEPPTWRERLSFVSPSFNTR